MPRWNGSERDNKYLATHATRGAEGMTMRVNANDFRVRPGKKIALKEWPTIVKPFCKSKKRYKKLLEEHVEELSSLQCLHYASSRYALLLIFQGMDAAGKDGAVRHVMSGVNPEGCEVFSFKQPSAEELKHDFLWRSTCRLPERGRIGIFNRSYYEEVLVVRVHPEILRNEGLSHEVGLRACRCVPFPPIAFAPEPGRIIVLEVRDALERGALVKLSEDPLESNLAVPRGLNRE